MVAKKRTHKHKKRKGFWTDGLSVDETRFSTLAFLTIVGFAYALIADYRGDLGDNLLSLVQAALMAFVGVNVADKVGNVMASKKRDKDDMDSYNEEEGGM